MTMLKLAALDSEDLDVLSSQTQDAVLKVGDINWLKDEGRLVMSMHRFAWMRPFASRAGFSKRNRHTSAIMPFCISIA